MHDNCTTIFIAACFNSIGVHSVKMVIRPKHVEAN